MARTCPIGWRTVCAVEIDPYCQRVLFARQRDGALSPFPIWDDVRTFDGKLWRGHVRSDGAPSALLRLIPTVSACCLQDSETVPCRRSQSGTMSEHSMESYGADMSDRMAHRLRC